MSKIQKAVSEIKSIEELANEDRWVNQVHPLVKLYVTILYIGTVVSFSKYNLSGLLVMAVYPVILFIMNDISVKRCAVENAGRAAACLCGRNI